MTASAAMPARVDRRPTVRPELAGIRTHRVFGQAVSYFEVPYAVLPGFRPLVLDLHVPAKAASDPVPVVVYAHGGGFFSGTRTMGPWAFLLDAGYAVASVGYRLSGESRFPGPIRDVAAAVRWVRAHAAEYGLDSSRVAGFGSSAGGYLINAVALASHCPDLVGSLGDTPEVSCELTAVIDHYAPVNFLRLDDDAAENAAEPVIGPGSPVAQFLGFVPSAQPDEADQANLCRYASIASPPFLIAHGDADGVVGIGQSRRLHDALIAAGAQAELIVVSGAGHGSPEFDQPAMHDRALAFLESATRTSRTS